MSEELKPLTLEEVKKVELWTHLRTHLRACYHGPHLGRALAQLREMLTPVRVGIREFSNCCVCPSCENGMPLTRRMKFCHGCGRHLLWDEKEKV